MTDFKKDPKIDMNKRLYLTYQRTLINDQQQREQQLETKSNNDRNKKFLQTHLKDNLKSFMTMYEKKSLNLAELRHE